MIGMCCVTIQGLRDDNSELVFQLHLLQWIYLCASSQLCLSLQNSCDLVLGERRQATLALTVLYSLTQWQLWIHQP